MELEIELNKRFYIDNYVIEVIKIIDKNQFKIKVIGEFLDNICILNSRSFFQLLPNVRLSSGTNAVYPIVKVIIEADPIIKISTQ